jgi:hypothetical protein
MNHLPLIIFNITKGRTQIMDDKEEREREKERGRKREEEREKRKRKEKKTLTSYRKRTH